MIRHPQIHSSRAPASMVQSAIANPKSTNAFTLVELMVAVAVTAILILAINQVFVSVSDGVTRGLSLSEIMATSRIVGDQIENDFDEMIGPEENGILVIVNQNIGPVHIVSDDDFDEDGTVDADEPGRTVRSDHIVFIRRRAAAEPMTPSSTNGYAGSSNAAYLRLWMGHCRRADPVDGSHPNGELGDDTGQTDDRYASRWVLGRQALFLDPDPSGNNNTTNGTFFDAPAETNSGNPNLGTSLSNPRMYHGFTDVAQGGLVSEDTGSSSSNVFGAMVGTTTEPSTSNPPYNKDRRLWLGLEASGATGYLSRAYDYTFARQRLLVRTESGDFDPWEIGQMHPYLAGGVSDLVIAFAGDYETPTGIDRNADGSIKWYDMDNPPTSGFSSSGTGQSPIRDSSAAGIAHADQAFVFRHGSGNTNWPMLIRFRYRIHDARGELAGADGELGQWFEQIVTVRRN